ncbi:O-methyltransferase mpaG [Paramyrothecium foliicola]|nr:O-methyltransferase mpaG [Paramyrothecium foliicola]
MASNGQNVKVTPVGTSVSAVAAGPRDLASIPELLRALNAGVEALQANGSEELRQDLSTKARDIMLALETPRETSMRHIWGNPQRVVDLAAELRADAGLLGRLLRHLGAMGYIKETGPNEYLPTNFSKALSVDMIGDAYIALPSATGAAQLKYHEFSKKHSWQLVTDAKDTALNYAYKTDLDFFADLQSQGYGEHFNNHMQGVGHDLEEFRGHHPSAPGKLILQDLPVIVSRLQNLSPAITAMGYDFHTEQAIKGARAYYMHSVLHDWPDKVCDGILTRVKEAMRPGYSKLLINENVIPTTGAWMGVVVARHDHKGPGLKIVKIWGAGRGVESLIEVELV